MINVEKNSTDILFEVEGLNFWYGKERKQVLFDVNVNILKKQTTALIGPSGCGKSTFIKMLNRLNANDNFNKMNGKIKFEGRDISNNKTMGNIELRQKIGMVSQDPVVFPFSIYDNIALGLRNIGIRKKDELEAKIIKVLKKVDLYDEVKNILKSPAKNLSGGQKQKLCIARTIALEPDVILMDEPTSNLDPIATQKIENLILELEKEYTIILVTHSMGQAQRISDRTIFFYKGKVIENSPTREMFTNPKEKLTQEYLMGKIG